MRLTDERLARIADEAEEFDENPPTEIVASLARDLLACREELLGLELGEEWNMKITKEPK